MLSSDNNTSAFFALVRAGLWETEARLSPFNEIDFAEVYRLAGEQSVVGLVAAGLEHVTDVKLSKEVVLTLVGETLQLEQRNQAMNQFIEGLVQKLRQAGIYSVLVKGQGIAQCYERPLWRACGDVDLLLSSDHYEKAKEFLIPLANSVETESDRGQHLGMTIGQWVVELHGHLYCGLSNKMDKAIDAVQDEVMREGKVRSWMDGETQVLLPAPDNDLILIFTHFLKHFYKGGLGMRQICDWCRLLWTYRDSIDRGLLKSRLRAIRLVTEWKAFGAYAVDYLGMSPEAMPLYDVSTRWKRKAKRIHSFIMTVGNMGHNRYKESKGRGPFIVRKLTSFSRRIVDTLNHSLIFPLDSLRFFPTIVFHGVRSAMKGR